MADNILKPLVLSLLIISQLVSSNASTISGTTNLLHEDQHRLLLSSEDRYKIVAERSNGRKDLEYDDYSGTGPNERHTPVPPSGGD